MFPGQGSQFKGMGKDLFPQFAKETQRASELLGYDLAALCLEDPNGTLGQTQFTQPALYVVNAFRYLSAPKDAIPNFLIGHSLGEYNALLAAGAFDFETGLRIVQKRGELMAAASGGGMAAVIGVDAEKLRSLLDAGLHSEVDLGNINSPEQLVIAGPKTALGRVVQDFERQKIRIIPLNVSAPFHSRYMQPAASAFADFLADFTFSPLKIPVIANVTARPYGNTSVGSLLSRQIDSSVQWTDSIRFLMGKGVSEYQELGGKMLSRMVKVIQQKCEPLTETAPAPVTPSPLGSHDFKQDYGLKYAYLAGSMYRGIASSELVIRMAKANMMGFLGTGGMELEWIGRNLDQIHTALGDHRTSYGANLLHQPENPELEMQTVDLFLEKGVRNVEASAFVQLTPALVRYRLAGLEKGPNGEVVCHHNLLAKVSRPEVAEAFLQPAPRIMVEELLDQGMITTEQAELATHVPMTHDLCVEADSAGHSDGGLSLTLFPTLKRLATEVSAQKQYAKPIRVGLAGGIGTPEAAACAFLMGADFILTGSINQCTVEAGMSEQVKNILQDINVQDTTYAPSGDRFEVGSQVQVLKKGVLFPARARKLYEQFKRYDSLEDLPEQEIMKLEQDFFKRSLDSVWSETQAYLVRKGRTAEVERAARSPKHKMALVFRWYFAHSMDLALTGSESQLLDFQVHTGPAQGAFNQWVKGSELENWRNRNVDTIGIKLMEEATQILTQFTITHN